MKELTKAEEQVMQILWKLGKGVVNDILNQMDEPRPAYNTVSTIVRILEKKGFVGYRAYGKTHEYYPLIEKKVYTNFFFKNFLGNYFGGSFSSLVSFFAKENDMDVKELEELLKHVQQEPKSGEEDAGNKA
jgi:predicted transcriptional regulator